MLALILALLLPPAPVCGSWEAGDRSPPSVRADAKRRVSRTARALGASSEAIRVLLAIARRESSYDPCAVHVLGEGENGLGIFGLSVRWTLPLWDRWSSPVALHSPVVSTVIAVRILRRAVVRHGATTWTMANSVYGTGRVRVRDRLDAKFCALLAKHDVDCNDSPEGQLGTVLGLSPSREQYAFYERMESE